MRRKLAAMLMADIVGYSARMQTDAADTIAAVSDLTQTVLRPIVQDQSGQIVKSMGDGWLIRFDSPVDAVGAAMRIQDALAAHNGLTLRIGIHIGDVTETEDDIFGDSVNIAARLEALAPDGGIAISEATYAGLDGTLTPSFSEAGPRQLKNIDRPVNVWIRSAPSRPTDPAAGRTADANRFPHLTILPVTTADPRGELQDLAASLTADFGSLLRSIIWLSSTTETTPRTDGYTLRTSLRARGDRLRLEARVTDPNDTEIWSQKFDGALADSFDWQDQVGEDCASQITRAILDLETMRLSRIDDAALSAEQCMLMGMMVWRDFAPGSYAASAAFHTRAIAANPDLVAAYAEAILVTVAGQTVGYMEELRPYIARMPDWLAAAERFRGENPILDLNAAIGTYMRDQKPEALIADLAGILSRAPFDGRILTFAGWGYVWAGRADLAVGCFNRAIRLGRLSPFYVAMMGGAATAAVQLGNDAEAIRYAEAGLELSSTYPTLHSTRAAAYAHLGQMDKAADAIAAYSALVPGKGLGDWRAINNYGGSEGGKRYFKGLGLAGLPE